MMRSRQSASVMRSLGLQAKTMKNLSEMRMWCSGFITLNFWKVSRVIFDGRKVRKSRIINFLYLKVRRR